MVGGLPFIVIAPRNYDVHVIRRRRGCRPISDQCASAGPKSRWQVMKGPYLGTLTKRTHNININ